ncbi:Glycerone kinase [Alteracholeplasma palmae J233]|uniref:Glycerone kinase n=1 Tax=Alteracholeplasma palmae (strain ATCC 49389 / J233) TaxID=1318466 RepID=U4KKC5_ALTPJ|nr:DAK2 domain-containing protein [Alteracholeplasma palmae]CCV63988.1 Glycerone kinase [Alteracholeplasma palmae J233]
MSNKKVSGNLFKKMVTNGAIHLKNNHKEVDHLNVFPVPDGDTGTNMQMTMMAGVKEVNTLESESIVDVSKILSRGLLMGARGNSGVILSQFFRGVYSELSKIDNGAVDPKQFIQSLVGGYQMAYRAVMDPVEGTILTVVRESAERVLKEQSNLNSIEEVLKVYLAQAKETLIKTPELLPVLKEAGVVDSGGAGFIKIIEGMLMALEGNILSEEELAAVSNLPKNEFEGAHNLGDIDIKYGYCTEFIVQLFNKDEFEIEQIRTPLGQMGDSMVVVADDDLLKVHVHTNQPGVALTLAQKYGELKTIKVENMRTQHSNIMGGSHDHNHEQDKPKSKYALIAVASGEGIQTALKELGVDHIIDGGQTMNPSTEAFVNAVKQLNAENVIILPNNSNVILSAEQALDLCPECNIRVLRTKSVAQGYASLMAFDPTVELDDNIEAMAEVVSEMRSGEVTYAVRDTEMNGVSIKEGDYIGISKSKIIVADKNRFETTSTLLKDMISENSEIVTVFYGNDVNEEELEKVVDFISSTYPDLDVETVEGKQDIYSYIIAVE